MTTFASHLVQGALERAGLLVEVRGRLPGQLTGITDDSRQVTPGALFVAVRGTARDGHDFLAAIADRAGATIVEDATRTTLPSFVVRDARRAAPIAAAAAYGEPGAKGRRERMSYEVFRGCGAAAADSGRSVHDNLGTVPGQLRGRS